MIDSALRVPIQLLILLGALLKVGYTAFGLAALPLFLIKGVRSLEDERQELGRTIEAVRDSLRAIQEKYQRSHMQVSKRDKLLLNKLRREEKSLNHRSSNLTKKIQAGPQISWRFVQKLLKMITPFRIAVGIASLLVSLLLVFSLAIANIDRFLNSKCGLACGYLLDEPVLYNPLDHFLVLTSKLFPLDLFLMTLILIYVYLASLFAQGKLGLWNHGIKKRESSPQALTLLSLSSMLMMLAFSMQFAALAPHYTTFGSQTNSDGSPCTQTGKMTSCQVTVVSTMIQGQAVLYWLNWALCLSFLGCLGFCATRKTLDAPLSKVRTILTIAKEEDLRRIGLVVDEQRQSLKTAGDSDEEDSISITL